MSILPSFLADQINEEKNQLLDVPKEYGIDFATGQLTGKIVEGKEAIKVWIWNCLKTQRFRYPIYSWDYGTDLEQYIGQTVSEEFLNADCEDEIREAMLVNPYITDIEDFTADFRSARLNISFTAVTKFGDAEVEHSV
mgnify:FL=1|jgi:hypothetical protein|nr:MAG TPA: Protein of unknown function (DUF2634) [Caudoviricetes sp.]